MLGSFIFVMFPRVISFSVLFCMLECSFFEKFRWSAGTDSRFAIGISSLIYFKNCISPYIVFALFTVASCKVPVIIVYACICFALNLRFFLIVFYFILFFWFLSAFALHSVLTFRLPANSFIQWHIANQNILIQFFDVYYGFKRFRIFCAVFGLLQFCCCCRCHCRILVFLQLIPFVYCLVSFATKCADFVECIRTAPCLFLCVFFVFTWLMFLAHEF